MFAELSKQRAELLKRKLNQMNIPYEEKDATIKGDSEEMVHLDLGQLSESAALEVAGYIESLYLVPEETAEKISMAKNAASEKPKEEVAAEQMQRFEESEERIRVRLLSADGHMEREQSEEG